MSDVSSSDGASAKALAEVEPRPLDDPNADEEVADVPEQIVGRASAADKGKAVAPDDAPAIPSALVMEGPQKPDMPDVESGDDNDEIDDADEESDDEEQEEEDEEPRLKYARLTQHLGPAYRNGDATSSFLVAGDKMIVGTHNGNINVVELPIFQSLRVYHAHSASVTSVSISPYPPPLPTAEAPQTQEAASRGPSPPPSRQGGTPSAVPARRPREAPPIADTPSNRIYIATSSMDGNVCIQNLFEMRDVQLRNFARPVQAVALSPEYKSDRTYLSGGLAGHLILTVGGSPGRSVSTTTGTAAATASGWLGSMGIGTNTGKDTILHSGEGTISTIKWSLSGKYAVWLNEHGIKIMRTKLHLESTDAEDAWKRIGHIDRPQTDEWDTMASVWKGRVEWIDEQATETDESTRSTYDASASPATAQLQHVAKSSSKAIERLLVGWGGTIWIIHVHPGGIGVGRNAGERTLGRAEIVKILRMDCIISGISLYTQNLLLVLAFCVADEDEEEEEDDDDSPQKRRIRGHQSKPSITSIGSQPSGGLPRKQNNPPPELRLIDLTSQAEIDKDGLSVSRYERLSAGDYHLGILPARTAASALESHRGALDAIVGLGADVWNLAINPRAIFSSGASIRSRGSGDDASSSRVPSSGSIKAIKAMRPTVHPNLAKPGAKIFIHSPYDCILATKRDLGDHLGWLLEHQQYKPAWELLDEHPEIVSGPLEKTAEVLPLTPTKQTVAEEFFDDSSSAADTYIRSMYSSAAKEKRRIGELWIKQLVEANDWAGAGQVCGRVLTTPDRWDAWVWTFAGAKKYDEMVNYLPTKTLRPPMPRTIYEVMLGHYIQTDKPRFRDLLDRWPTDLFDLNIITTELENQLKYRDVREDSVEDGEKGRDWRIVMESLAKLHEANGRQREALKCYIRLQDADGAFRLIREYYLIETVADDIASFIGLRVSSDDLDKMDQHELEEVTSEAINLLVEEAQHGLVKPDTVVSQLESRHLDLYLFFYLRGLWRGEGLGTHEHRDHLLDETKSVVDDFADLAVRLFAQYERALLMDFLKQSTSYGFEKAVQECERFRYDDELIYLYSKTGQMKRALYLIIDRLKDVRKAIDFAKEQDDPDLWEDLLDYSMDKPSFIRGLLEQVGTAINPIKLVRRIPEGLAIEGLRDGIRHIMKEHEIQHSISEGVARVLRSEVAVAQADLRNGRRRGVQFGVAPPQPPPPPPTIGKEGPSEGQKVSPAAAASAANGGEVTAAAPNVTGAGASLDGGADVAGTGQGGAAADGEGQDGLSPPQELNPGHCGKCHAAFHESETETLVGFACGHVFHLSHLLEMLYPGREPEPDFAVGNDNGSTSRRFLVGLKVTHARLLKDRIRGGCPVCAGKVGG